MQLWRNMSISAAVLSIFAVAGTSIVAWTYYVTRDRIAENERQVLLSQLQTLVPANQYDNHPTEDVLYVTAPKALGSKNPVAVFRARLHHKPVAAIFSTIAPDGYNGNINLLVAVKKNGILAGVRVVQQNETPGLGDAIEASHSNWIYGFDHKSLENPTPRDWKVKRDGGVFDQFTGATISPRAVVKAVYNTLVYFKAHQHDIFEKNEVHHAEDH